MPRSHLVLCHFEIIGYSLCSLTRASSVVNCQWALASRSFRSRFHAWTFVIRVAFAAIRPPRHCRLRGRSSSSAMLNQLPCLGVEWLAHVSAMLVASGGSKASYSDAWVWVLRLAITKRSVSACGECCSPSAWITCAPSPVVRCAVTCVYR